MENSQHQVSYKTYWYTWGILLVLTMGMIFVSGSSLPRAAFVGLLVGAMIAKASFILGTFMHLRFEKLSLILMVVLALSLTALALFFGIAPDGLRILHLTEWKG